MATNLAEKSMGTTLTLSPGGSATLIADLTDIGAIGITASEIDTTTLASPNGYKEYLPSLKDAGEVALKGMIKSETNMTVMLGLADSQLVMSWLITTPLGSTWAFTGFVKKWMEVDAKVGGVRQFDGSIRISGKPVYTAGTVISA